MTTIAYKDGIVARDSRSTDPSGFIVSDKKEKMRIRDGIIFFCTGYTSHIEKLIAVYFGEEPNSSESIDASALVIDGDSFYVIGADENGIFKNTCEKNEMYAGGSGGDIAMGAMEMGASARAAVKIAMRRDSKTGGKIKVFKVK